METVAVTGGCGVLGRFLVKRLCENPQIQEVRVIDRSPKRPETHPKLRYIQVELSGNETEIDRALLGVTTVIHAAKADIPLTYLSKEGLKDMWRDNVQATECLVERMIARKISRLIYVGDAYSALPIDDNFGLAEDIHRGLPSSFLLGEWGESRVRAELLARKAVEKDDHLDGIFLRPTWIHSEIASSFWKGLRDLIDQGRLPYIPGERRGLHQFIYAGNLAETIEKCIFFLREEPKKYANEIVYLTDDTRAVSFIEMLRDRVGALNLPEETPYWSVYLSSLFRHLMNSLGKKSEGELHFHTWRTIFEKVIGFSDKKSRLLLSFKPQISPKEAHERSLLMFNEGSLDGKSRDLNEEDLKEIDQAKRLPLSRRGQQA